MKYMDLRRLYPATITHEETLRVSVAIAHLHILLQEYKGENYEKPNYATWNLDYNQSAYAVLEKSPNSKTCSSNEMKQFKKTTEDVISFLKKTPYPKQLKESFLHGDIGLEHAQMLPNGSIYFFDWADRAWGPITRELSVLLFHSYRESDISFQRWKQLKEWIVKSYSQVNELKQDDVDVITPFIFRRCLDEVRYLSELAIRNDVPTDARAIARRFDLATKLFANPQ